MCAAQFGVTNPADWVAYNVSTASPAPRPSTGAPNRQRVHRGSWTLHVTSNVLPSAPSPPASTTDFSYNQAVGDSNTIWMQQQQQHDRCYCLDTATVRRPEVQQQSGGYDDMARWQQRQQHDSC
ncbi:hypothetical protein BDZ97DRAFT_1922377 [Flammula alnicola]|nr:hypothetical protein BDZ97DRAFT_1922377 [Flammula alnicola]